MRHPDQPYTGWETLRGKLEHRCPTCGGAGKISHRCPNACFCTGKCQTQCPKCKGTGKA